MGIGLSTDRPGSSQPFMLYDGAVRGRLVRLNGVAETILGRHDYPEAVSRALGEAMAAGVALAGGLKFDGSFTFQLQGDGPLHTLVTDITSDHEIRGCAKFREEDLAALAPGQGETLTHLVGSGHIAFTVDQGPDMDRYQGIIELAGASIGECIHHYFRQSEQLETAVKIAAGKSEGADGDAAWQVAALLIQRMPTEGGKKPTEEDEDAWRSSVILMSSITDAELLDPRLTEEDLLRRLYGTVGGQLLERQDLTVGCRCSRERSAKILASFPMDEVRSMAVDGKVSMTCEFCEISFDFSDDELSQLESRFGAL